MDPSEQYSPPLPSNGFQSFLPDSNELLDDGFSFSDDDISNALDAIGSPPNKASARPAGAIGAPHKRAAARPAKTSIAVPPAAKSKPKERIKSSTSKGALEPKKPADIIPSSEEDDSIPVVDITLEVDISTETPEAIEGTLPSYTPERGTFSSKISSFVALLVAASKRLLEHINAALRGAKPLLVRGHATFKGLLTRFGPSLKGASARIRGATRGLSFGLVAFVRKLPYVRPRPFDPAGHMGLDAGKTRLNYRIVALGAGVLLTGLVVLLIWVFSSGSKGQEGTSAPGPPPPPRVASMLPVDEDRPNDVEPSSAPKAVLPASNTEEKAIGSNPSLGAAATDNAASETPDPMKMITITLKGIPEDAKIFVDGKIYGTPIMVPRSHKSVKIEAVTPGMGRVVKRVVPLKDKTVVLRSGKDGHEKSHTGGRSKRSRAKREKSKSSEREHQKRLASNPFGA